ncbi:TPA: hypothetical protein N0F65_003942 [Lagenidium giganteum]|uniref:Uncharacterized protein n=1 Tax=Lagenidium giganteum TaxID=4803 RepID=A0AAV2ZCY8_9STRA|nr:TPA: hypothetical protein N0F65_003942 [Lagenidium giganteum]
MNEFLYESPLKSDTPVKISKSERVVSVFDGNFPSYTSGILTYAVSSQLTGGKGFASLRDAYITLQYVVTLKNTGAAAMGAAVNRFCTGFKTVSAIAAGVETGLNPYIWVTQRSGVSTTIAQQNGKGAFVTTGVTGNVAPAAAGTIAGTWYHMLKIRLVDLHPIFKELDLVGNPQIKLNLKN